MKKKATRRAQSMDCVEEASVTIMPPHDEQDQDDDQVLAEEQQEKTGDQGVDDAEEADDDEEDFGSEAGLGLQSLKSEGRDGFVSEEVAMMSLENKISPLTFCNAFPFHLVFDRNLHVKQVGKQKLHTKSTSLQRFRRRE